MSSLPGILYTFLIVLFSCATLRAQIIVNSLDDDGADGDCELREAIINAENDDTSGSTDCAAGSGNDSIDLSGLSGEIVLQSGQMTISTTITIEGPGVNALSISGNNASRIFFVIGGGWLGLSDVTLKNGSEQNAGAIWNRGRTDLADVRIEGNHVTGGGGAIINQGNIAPANVNNGILEIFDSHFMSNTAGAYGGAIRNDSLGAISITRSTFSGNSADRGGAIYNQFEVVADNTTFSANTASETGGAIDTRIGGPDRKVELYLVTMTGNEAVTGGGGIWIETNAGVDTAYALAFSSIIAGNEDPSSPDIAGHIDDFGYNILGDDSGSSGLTNGVNDNQVGTSGSPIDPRLFHLADYGGDTWTHLLRPDSPAIDKGSCTLPPATHDQRLITRPNDLNDGTYPNTDDGCDVGAVEMLFEELDVGSDFVGTVLMEGPYDGPGMTTDINASIPLTQPYGDAMYSGTSLEYDGSETVESVPPNAVDWVLVSLRYGTTADTEVARRAGFLLDEGIIVDLDESPLNFPDVVRVPYWVVVDHRNHAAVMSAEPSAGFLAGLGEWDFTADGAYSDGAPPMKVVNLEESISLMFAGDGNADGIITAPDFNIWNAATTAGAAGYQPGDYNLDGVVTAPDFNIWNANTTAGAASQVPD